MLNHINEEKTTKRCVYIIGSKSIGQYGGYESFVLNLLNHQKDNDKIQYYIACKANGQGYMDLTKLPGAERISSTEFTYCNAHGFLIPVHERMGSGQAIYYDIKALKWVCDHIERNNIKNPIVYILASRIGPFVKKYVKRIHAAGGLVYQNPDGHEDWRGKWSLPVRKYWKFSEKMAVKNADLVICDSINIENYIKTEYKAFNPKTTFIAYGSDIKPSSLADDDATYQDWLQEHDLRDRQFYISVGRFVPENNFETMIREFMKSSSTRDFAIITTENTPYAKELQDKLNFRSDPRIKFVGTVYDPYLLTKIRNNACGYFHGHEVGGTNPSLLESLGSTNLNLLHDNPFNREVAAGTALYWTKEPGSLSNLINTADAMSPNELESYGKRAKERITDEYSWDLICSKYEKVFENPFSQ